MGTSFVIAMTIILTFSLGLGWFAMSYKPQHQEH
jgi:hypothetical protein